MSSGREPQAAHPSFLELDRLALGAARAPGTADHVAGCARCRSHLAALGDVPPPSAELRERAAADDRGGGADLGLRVRRTRRWLLGGMGLAGACAAAAVLLLYARPRPGGEQPGGYVGDKGLPSVWIYVKHETELRLWDGEQPLAPGDRLRLKIDPQGHTHADVFTQEGDERPLAPVWSGSLKAGEVTTLPAAWQLEGDAGSEALIVVLASGRVSPAQAQRFVAQGPPAGVWLRRFVLHKTARDPEPRR